MAKKAEKEKKTESNWKNFAIKNSVFFWLSRSLFCDIQEFIWRTHIWGLFNSVFYWLSRSLFCDIQDFIWRTHIWGLLRARSHSLHKLGYRLQRCGNWHYFCQRYLQQDKYTCCNPRVRWYPDFFHQNDRKCCKRVILGCPGTLSSAFLERPGKP